MNALLRPALFLVLLVVLNPAAAQDLPRGATVRFGSADLRDLAGWSNATLSPDGKHLILQTQRGTQRIELATGRSAGAFAEKNPIFGRQMRFNADGSRVVSIAYSDVSVWDAASGKTLATVKRPLPFGDGAASLSADGKIVAVGGSQDFNAKDKPVSALVWDVEKNAKIVEVPVLQNQSAMVALSPDGRTMATWGTHFERTPPKDGVDPAADPNRLVQLWNAASGKEIAKVPTDSYGTPIALFSPDGKSLALSAGNGLIRVLDAGNGSERRRFFGRSDQGTRLAFSPDGKTLASGGTDGTIQLWDMEKGERGKLYSCPFGTLGFGIRGIAFTANDRAVAWTAAGLAALAWEVQTETKLTKLEGHVSGVRSVAFLEGGKEMITAGDDGQVLKWTLDGKLAGDIRLSLPGGYGLAARFPMTQVALTPDGTKAISQLSQQGLYELPSGRQIASMQYGTSLDSRTYLCTDGRTLLVAPLAPYPPKPMQKALKTTVWDVASGAKIAELEAAPSDLLHAVATKDRIVTVTTTRSDTKTEFHISAWELKTGKLLGSHSEPGGFGNTYLAASPDGTSAVVSTPSGKLLVFGLADGKVLKELNAGGRKTLTAHPAFSRDGKTLAIASSLGFGPGSGAEISLFKWDSGEVLGRFRGHTGAVAALMFSPDGAKLASGSLDTTVLLWTVADAEK